MNLRARGVHVSQNSNVIEDTHAPFDGELEEPDPSVVWVERLGSWGDPRRHLGIGIRILDPPLQSLEGAE